MADIWRWNAKTYGIDHAEAYAEYLEISMDALGLDRSAVRAVEGHPAVRKLIMRKRAGGHGHIAFYRVEGDTVQIVRVLHTSRDWPGILEDE